ncbi:MAG TPA: GNAT family N-acetyltransferase [Chitinispirillaceae bacterium]|nr:GNAT family N-acetyltransferase [Chitinispirillaceae bacterium]
MFNSIIINIHQFVEHLRNSGLKQAFQKTWYVKREVIPVVKELANVSKSRISTENQQYQFIEVDQETYKRCEYSYRVKSRLLKVNKNIKKGYRAFAVVRDNMVIGDIWYAGRERSGHPILHGDLDLLFITSGPQDVYMFDMFIDPLERGKNIAVFLMSSSLDRLRESGYSNVFGFFEAGNIPALWVHRMLGFSELDKVLLSRYGLFRSSRKKTKPLLKLTSE